MTDASSNKGDVTLGRLRPARAELVLLTAIVLAGLVIQDEGDLASYGLPTVVVVGEMGSADAEPDIDHRAADVSVGAETKGVIVLARSESHTGVFASTCLERVLLAQGRQGERMLT